MRIAEIFRSLQGEGRLTGTDSLFVRFSGCNLRCRFCDTRYASWSPEGEDLSLDEVLAQLVAFDPAADAPVRHAVVTGGEPLLFAEVAPLCQALRGQGRHVTIETAGTLYRPVACDLMSISPKLAHSTPTPRESPAWAVRHEAARHEPEAMRRLLAEYDYQLKFVVHRPEDCGEVEAYLAEFPEVDRQPGMADARRRRGRGVGGAGPLAGALLCRGRAALLSASADRVVRLAAGGVRGRGWGLGTRD